MKTKVSKIEKTVDAMGLPKKGRFGKLSRKTAIVGVALVLVMSVIVSAGLLSYYGKITTTATVSQSILVDGNDWTTPVANSFDVTGGCTICRSHWIRNKACIDGTVSLDTTITGPGGPGGVTVTYKDSVHLENKDGDWNPIVDDTYADVTFELVGEEFVYELNVVGMDADTNYVFIYRADEEDRFTNWHGVGSIAIKYFMTDDEGNYSISTSTELGTDLPKVTDWNNAPPADYTQPPDEYLHETGAKLWIVTATDWDSTNWIMSGWTAADYLFETELIRYFDNVDNEITIPAGEFINFVMCYGFAINIIPGTYTIITTVSPVVV